MNTTRDDALRALLVGRVTTTRRRRWRLPVLGIGAFAVAGALTAGALVSSGLLQQQADPIDAKSLIDTGAAGDVSFLADPVERTSDSETSLTLGARPTDAAQVAIGAQCAPPRTVSVTVDGTHVADVTCGDAGRIIDLHGTTSTPTLDLTPSTDGGYTVWAAWARPDPIPGPSVQQQEALADGIVTRTEYLAAWNRYLGCMRAIGHPIDATTQTQMFVAVGIPGDDYQADARCYASEFGDVDGVWQTEHPSPPGDDSFGAQNYVPATDDPRYAQ
jgi:hypothetical protein